MSDTADQSIDVNDPEFWSKVLPPQSSVASKLLDKLEDPDFKDADGFMLELKSALRDFLKAKVEMTRYSPEDEEIMISVITQVSLNSAFSKKQQQTAVRWMKDLYKPTRTSRSRTNAPLLQSDSEGDEEKKEKKEVEYSSFHGTGLLCGVCGLEGGGWFCTGPCRRVFHTLCLEGNSVPAADVVNEEKDKDLVISRIMQKWECADCVNKQGICAICGQKGLYHYSNDTSTHLKSDYVVLCSAANCGFSMHPQCFKMTGKRFTCPAHTCDICGSAEEPSTMLQCAKCPLAFHKSCSLTEAVRINRKYALCSEHAAGYEPVTYANVGKQKEISKQNSRKIRAKLKEFAQKQTDLCLVIRNEASAKSLREPFIISKSTPSKQKPLPVTPSKRPNPDAPEPPTKQPHTEGELVVDMGEDMEVYNEDTAAATSL